MQIDRIGIITSGGDCQGMNACIYNVVKMAAAQNIEVLGFIGGYKGVINNNFMTLTPENTKNITHLGGTILKTSRCYEFTTPSGQDKAVKTLKDNDIKCLIIIGGDGSYRGALKLIEKGVRCIAIPGTIDNDLFYTDRSLGFETAVNNAVTAIESIKQSLATQERVGIIEVMGRECGDIALYSGVGSNSNIIVTRERPTEQADVVRWVKNAIKRGTPSPTIVISEGMFDLTKLAKKIEAATNKEVRINQLGYIQRGGTPTVNDRILAMQFGTQAVELISQGIFNKAIGIKNNKIIETTISDALTENSNFDYNLLDLFIKLNN